MGAHREVAGDMWRHGGTRIGDHLGCAGGLVGHMEGVGSTDAHRYTHEGAEGHMGTWWDMWGVLVGSRKTHEGEGGHSWGCGGTHGSVAGHVKKHRWTGVGVQQDTRGDAMRCGTMAGHMWAHVGGMWEHGGDGGAGMAGHDVT